MYLYIEIILYLHIMDLEKNTRIANGLVFQKAGAPPPSPRLQVDLVLGNPFE